MGVKMISNENRMRENYFICGECEFCSTLSYHTAPPFLCVGCAKACSYLYDDDKCPLGKWDNAND